jgi:hypothetical protein
MALRTTSASDLTQPGTIDPPFKEAPLDDSGFFNQPWNSWFTRTSDRVAEIWQFLNSGTVSAGVVRMQTGTGTSDPAGALSVTLPVPYAARTLGFQADARPAEPAAYFNQGTVQALPLDVITGTLSKDSGGGTIVAVPNAPFTWFATGV